MYGFLPIETPAMENLTTLTGKYGDEGDQLLFKILDSGDFLKSVDEVTYSSKNSSKLSPSIATKGLRYDLTVPFARFVVQHQTDISFPFKRYQIQPVWRADRPQKGRYREFWQCDADVIGTKSLLCEADFISIYHEVFTRLELPSYELRINHRKVLEAVASTCGFIGNLTSFTIIIDKLDKIGWDGVTKELLSLGMAVDKIEKLKKIMVRIPLNMEAVSILESSLQPSAEKDLGLKELTKIISLCKQNNTEAAPVLDLSLARGLDYYTGCIFEAVIRDSGIGSVSGGGRYDNLTEVFGMSGVSGVGISFGLDRIYDVMLASNSFSENRAKGKSALICHFDQKSLDHSVALAARLRQQSAMVEVYPDVKNIRKQFDYANKVGFGYAIIIGDAEIESGTVQLKDLEKGTQEELNIHQLLEKLS